MPCFSTGIPVTNDAMVGNRNPGFTAVADQVTAPSLTNRLTVGIVPPFRESWPNPSRTKRMTCSLGTVEAEAGADTAAPAMSFRRTRQRKNRDTASIRIGHPRSKLINLYTDQFFLFCSKGTSTLSWRFPPRQASTSLTCTAHQILCGSQGSWHKGRCGVMLISYLRGVNESAPGTGLLSRG